MSRTLALGLVALLLAASSARAEIYRWVDANGTTHFVDDVEQVPEDQRPGAKVFQSKVPPAPAAEPSGPTQPTQAALAEGVARELGVLTGEGQDPVSALQNVGIYPSGGWNPRAPLAPAAIAEVARTARAAARGGRIDRSVAEAERGVLATADDLGIPGPPPTVATEPEPAPAPEPPLVIAPQVYVEVEAPPTTVIIEEPDPQQITESVYWGNYPFGPVFAPLPPRKKGKEFIPDRIVPLSSPAGRLRGPAVEPLRGPSRFQRPPPP